MRRFEPTPRALHQLIARLAELFADAFEHDRAGLTIRITYRDVRPVTPQARDRWQPHCEVRISNGGRDRIDLPLRPRDWSPDGLTPVGLRNYLQQDGVEVPGGAWQLVQRIFERLGDGSACWPADVLRQLADEIDGPRTDPENLV
jgi:hypothetical protein